MGYSQLKWLVDIFRAKIVDISEHSVTIEVSAGHLLICFNLHVTARCIYTHLVKLIVIEDKGMRTEHFLLFR